MKPGQPLRLHVDGDAGALELVINEAEEPRRGIALVAHPHPLHGGTLDNKVVQTLAKSFLALNYVAVRMNFRGVGGSAGHFDAGQGETRDWLTVLHAMRERYGALPILLAGFSFGAFVQSRVARALSERGDPAQAVVLVAPAVGHFAVEDVPGAALVVHGDEDDVVPLSAVLAWARPQQLPVTVLPGTGHFFHGYLASLQQVVTRFCASFVDAR